MSYDDYFLDRQLKKEIKTSPALDLIRGLENRRVFKDAWAKESLELFAEQELVRKTTYSEMKCELPGIPRSSFLMVFSADGTKIASTHGNHNIYVSDSRSGKNIKTLVGHPRTPWCIAFHPTSNQIVASGCLGGQVRIWDLSGGSEVWTTSNQSVIASIAFHPNDRVLVIATYNEVYFWDWSKPEPFVQCSTYNPKEKVRYVAFDNLGHKLITGIANSPQTRWERVRAPVPVPRQAERCASPYRRRITPRLVNMQPQAAPSPDPPAPRESFSSIPERERRITVCYRNLVREYEQLVQRYLQLYRPRTMIDRGTDPMETGSSSTTSGTQTPDSSTSELSEPSTSAAAAAAAAAASASSQPSISRTRVCDCQPEPSMPSTSQNLISPSKIFSVMRKSPTSIKIRATQTTESRKHKAERDSSENHNEKRMKKVQAENNNSSSSSDSTTTHASESNTQQTDMGTQTQSPRRHFLINTSTMRTPEPPTVLDQPSTSGYKLPCDTRDAATNDSEFRSRPGPGSRPVLSFNIGTVRTNVAGVDNNVDELLSNIRRTAEEEVRNRILPIIRSVPETDRPELIRLFENSREHTRMRFRQMCSSITKKPKRWPPPPTNTSSENNSSSEDESSTVRFPQRQYAATAPQPAAAGPSTKPEVSNASNAARRTALRNYNTELEQLVTTLLTEIENNETETNSERSDANVNNLTTTTQTATENTMSSRNTNSVASSTANERSTTPPPPPAQEPPSLTTLLPNAPGRTSSSQHSELISLFESLERDTQSLRNSLMSAATPTTSADTATTESGTTPCATTIVNTNTRTTNSTIYTSNSRRRFLSNRVSAFMPTRVNYTASRLMRSHRFPGCPLSSMQDISNSYTTRGSFALDELINYSERANSEDDPPSTLPSMNTTYPTDPLNISRDNIGIGNMYSNIVQDLESSLNDVRNIRASSRPGETSDMLSSFSERLENIMNQSETILRNLRSSMELLSATTEQGTSSRPPSNEREREPSWSFYDPNFYIRERTDDAGLSEILPTRTFNAVASDHTYPRNPDNTQQTGNTEHMSPLMTSLHITITHIQRQARLLRQQVESIERIDRAMLEVAQLQVLRQLIIELMRHVRNSGGESRSTGMSSVRQMMAGTRISDSSPYDSPVEEATAPPPPPPPTSLPPTIADNHSNTVAGNSSSAEPNSSSNTSSAEPSIPVRSRPRGSSRKTYPPSRSQRLCRRPSLVHFLSRRYMNRGDRGTRQNIQSRPTELSYSSSRQAPSFSNYSIINTSTLSLTTRRLENLLTEQMRHFTRPAESNTPPHRSSASIDLGEHILALRLHGCVLRMNRVLMGTNVRSSSLQSDPHAAVTLDGVSRYGARHTLSLIVDGMSRHMEEMGNSNFPQRMRLEIHGVLSMSLLLSELLLLQVVDSIPPPTGMNLDPERESLTSRIDQMCGQMLHSRFSSHSQQLTRSLRLMRLTMRHAYRALGQTYNARRNAMLPRHETDRRQLLGSINRRLRNINRTTNRQRSNNNPDQSTNNVVNPSPENPPQNASPADGNTQTSESSGMRDLYSILSDFIRRYSNSNEDDSGNNPSTSGNTTREWDSSQRPGNTSSNNSDDNDDESDWLGNNNTSSHNSNLYRTSNVNLSQSDSGHSRLWNVPSVQVNDVPVSEPSTYQQRLMSQRQRFADRVSELRHNPSIGLFRPRFLHPLYASVNPFDADLDDPQREPIYESDMITTVTPNHRLQAWDISDWSVPAISNSVKNVIVSECKIHNDASVDIAKDGTLLVTLLPSGGYLNVTNRLGVYSLKWETLGQCLYTTSFEQNAVSVSLSPLSRHLLVGLASRRVSIVSNDRWIMARIFKIEQKDVPGDRLPMVRELEQTRDSRINCIRWLPNSGQGIIYGTNTGQLIVLT